MTIKEELINLKFQWNKVLWVLCTFFLPISIPYIFINLLKLYKEKKYKNSLISKVVVITGASSGLGEALAHVFYQSGCRIVLAARRKNELERVKKDLLEKDTNNTTFPPVIIPVDLSELESIPKFVDKVIEVYGEIDFLINNAGVSVRSDIVSSSIKVDIKIMNINYFGTIALTKAVLPYMIEKQKGCIVFISSVQGKFALPFRSSYSASKHAIQAFSDSLRAEVAKDGIKVICISPGYIRTSLSLNALTANGEPYGQIDDATATGTTPNKMANEILKSILHYEKDVVISQFSGRIAYWLRFMCPSLYFWIMEQRAKKGFKKN